VSTNQNAPSRASDAAARRRQARGPHRPDDVGGRLAIGRESVLVHDDVDAPARVSFDRDGADTRDAQKLETKRIGLPRELDERQVSAEGERHCWAPVGVGGGDARRIGRRGQCVVGLLQALDDRAPSLQLVDRRLEVDAQDCEALAALRCDATRTVEGQQRSLERERDERIDVGSRHPRGYDANHDERPLRVRWFARWRSCEPGRQSIGPSGLARATGLSRGGRVLTLRSLDAGLALFGGGLVATASRESERRDDEDPQASGCGALHSPDAGHGP